MMKRIFLTAITAATMIGAATVPSFADALHSNGTTGQPYAVDSNAGSVQGQTNRSATGTANKTTHDGFRYVVD